MLRTIIDVHHVSWWGWILACVCKYSLTNQVKFEATLHLRTTVFITEFKAQIWLLDAPLLCLLWELVLQLTVWYILTLWMWSHWSAWLPPRLLFIGEKHASHQVQPLLDQDYRPFLHMSLQTILYHHGWMPVKAKKLNINSRHKYVVFFQEVPGGWTTCWPLYWVLLLRPAWLWYGGYGEAFLLGRHVPIWGL